MQYSKSGLQLIETFESCRLTAYQDQGGIWTIGYGHTANVLEGMVCTPFQAASWLMQDVQEADLQLNRMLSTSITLSQNEYDALTDFTFNVGSHNLWGSTLLHKLNAGDFAGAAAEFEKWDHVSGKVVAGLLRRRIAEETLFNTSNASD